MAKAMDKTERLFQQARGFRSALLQLSLPAVVQFMQDVECSVVTASDGNVQLALTMPGAAQVASWATTEEQVEFSKKLDAFRDDPYNGDLEDWLVDHAEAHPAVSRRRVVGLLASEIVPYAAVHSVQVAPPPADCPPVDGEGSEL